MNSILLVITFCHAEPSQSFKKNRIKLVTKVLRFYCCYLESLSLVTISVFLNLFQSAWTGFVFYSLRPFFSTPISVSLDITTNNYIFFIIKSTLQTSSTPPHLIHFSAEEFQVKVRKPSLLQHSRLYHVPLGSYVLLS